MPLDWVSRTMGIVIFIAIPSLAILSYRGWTKSLRQKLPQWRSALGVTSIVITFLSWFGAAILLLLGSFSDKWELSLALLALVGTILAFTLKGASRIEAIAAGVSMFAGITFGAS